MTSSVFCAARCKTENVSVVLYWNKLLNFLCYNLFESYNII